MNTLELLLAELDKLDITLWVENNTLRYIAPPGAMAPELQNKLIEHKSEFIAFLSKVDVIANSSLNKQIPIQPVAKKGPTPLSFSQERLWFLDQLEGSNATYNIPVALRLKGDLNPDALEKALAGIIQRHEVLRTVFVTTGDEPVQQIIPHPVFSLPVTDLSSLAQDTQAEQLSQLIAREAEWHFDLAQGTLLRASLLRLSQHEHILLLNMHHIVSDGWSIGILTNELTQLYLAGSAGSTPLPELPIQYADFAAWQRTWLQGENLDRQLNYWKNQLAAAPALLELPSDRPRPAIQTFHGKTIGFELDPQLAQAIQTLSRQHNTTLFMSLYAAFAVLLSRYSRQDDIVIGSPIANRNRAEIEPLIGFFVNTLVLRVDLSGNPTFSELLQQVQRTTLDAYAHQDLPFEKLVAELHPERTLSYSPIFQAVFALQNAPGGKLQMSGLDISFEDFENTIAKFDLTLEMEETDDGLAGFFQYNTGLFDEATIRRMITHWQTLLNGIVADPNERVANQPILAKTERQQVLVEWNNTRTDYPKDKCIHQLFEEQAKRSPQNIAVSFEGQSLTYRELNERANQLAHYLQKHGVGPDVLAGICMERSIEIVIGMLAVWKAGGAYVPIDPEYPRQRTSFIVEDAKPAIFITQLHLLDHFSTLTGNSICLDRDWPMIARESIHPVQATVLLANLAYIIYTSGSTGNPKGVMVSHQGLGNLAEAQAQAFAIHPDSRVLQFASINFDASISEFATAWVRGASICLAQKDSLLPGGPLSDLLRGQQITVATLPPSVLAILSANECPTLKTIISAGEACSIDLVEKWSQNRRFLNGYGPTEATVCSTIAHLDAQKNVLPHIGQPLANTYIYVLDSYFNPNPIGVAGELCISGVGLARGYLNRPDLTAEKFIPNPFSAEPGARMYRTGDLARWLPDGDIEFLGRIDQQVKIRGFRIELGEIEAVLSQHPDVRASVVLAREDIPGDKRLVAYLVTHQERSIQTGELRAHLKDKLPEYMLPSAFVFLEALPLTPNGKLDRKALPAPDASLRTSGYVAPGTPTEELLANIWAEVLKLDKVGIHDNFFELGGHSLLATQVISRLRKAFQLDLPVRSLFEAPTLADLAGSVEAARLLQSGHELVQILPVPRDQPQLLSFAQERLWFLDQLEGGSATYNIPVALRLKGSLDPSALEMALAGIIQRHEVLRTLFVTIADEPIQQIISNPAFSLPVTDLSALAQDAQAEQLSQLIAHEAQQPFDLAQGPLLRASLLRLSQHEHILLLNMHHIVSDGWSIGILINELASLYAAFLADSPSPLPELPIQYADFAAWQRAWLQGENLDRQLNYWKNQLAAAPTLLELPSDHPRPAIQTFHGKTIGFELDPQLTGAIKTLSRQHNTTLFMTLYAAFAVLLSRYSRQDDIVIGSPIANRNRAEIEPLIGFFVNTLALRADLSTNPTFSELLQQVQRTTLDAYAHQDLPFEKLVAELHPDRTLSHSPIFQVMFALQNAPDGELQMPGLDISFEDFENTIAKFDLTLSMAETGQSLAGAFEFNTNLFDEATIQRMIVHWQTLLNGIVSNPNERVASLPILTEAERQQVLVEWNDTHADYPKDKCIHQLFEEQAERTPQNIAVSFDGQSLTYQQLNQCANQLAHYLQKHGAGPDVLVGICMERSLEMIIALLGILKTGAAYVPLDPTYPLDRLTAIAQDSQIKFVISQPGLQNILSGVNGFQVVFLDERLGSELVTNPVCQTEPQNLAYVLFTSGTTGRPKGVALQHSNAAALIHWTKQTFSTEELSGILASTSIGFDLSVFEIFGTLCNGGQIILVENVLRLLNDIPHQPILINTVPSAITELLKLNKIPSSVQTIVLAGEALSTHIVDELYALPNIRRVVDAYGPTENTTYSTYCERKRLAKASIGRPLPSWTIYILDKQMFPVPAGIPGELYIGGIGVARGYLNRPDLTAEKFIPNPFSAEPGARMYRTGDLARRLPASRGDIEFLGRIDQQVKIRGFRIELGEIEAVLSQHPDVRASVVLAREDTPGDKRLVAYLVTHQEKSIQTGELRAHLKEKLPDYMLPSAFVFLEALPLTPNGKLDRKALPAPDASLLTSGYVAPGTPTEETLANIWAEVLKLDKVGIHDNFFELGGHSLLAVTLVERMRRAGFHTQVRVLFQSPTIRELSHKLTGESRAIVVPPNLIPDGCAHITPEMLPLVALTPRQIELIVSSVAGAAANVQDIYPLAPLQEGILFHHIMAEKGDPYLLKTVYSFDTHEHLERYLTALQAVIDRHDILRTGIVWEGLEQPIQVVWRNAPIVVEYLALDPTQADIAQQLQERFDPRHTRLDVTQVPLKHFFVAEDQPHQRWVMLELSHHLIGDHETLRFMGAEIEAYLLGELQDLAEPVPFRNYVAQVRLGVSQAEHEAFFRNMLGDVDQPTAPFGLSNVLGDGSGIVEAWKQVDPDLAIRLRKTARDLGVTPANLFHLAWALVLAKVSGRDDVVFGTVLFGRLQGEEDAGQVFGMTINTLPVRIQIGNDSALDGVRKTHRTLTQLIQHEYASLSLAQRCSGVTAPTPLFTAILNYRYSGDAVQPDSQEQERATKASQGIHFLTSEERTNYPFSMSVDDLGDGFQLDVQVAASIDPNRVCEFTHRALERLIETLENTPDTPLCQLDILPEAERRQVLLDWNDTRSDYPKDKCIHQLFEEQAERTPLNIAVSFEGQSLTYQQLNERANQLAHYLQEHGVGPEALVAVCVERSPDMLIALLGVLKAGGAYVPLDPDYPAQRIAYILADAQVKTLITHSHLLHSLPDSQAASVCLDTDWTAIARTNAQPPAPVHHPDHLAYTIYTSGSTGNPKGVQVLHRAVVNFLNSMRRSPGITSEDVLLAVTTLSFDIAALEILLPLTVGARVEIVRRDTAQDPEQLLNSLLASGATIMQATPITWKMLLENNRLDAIHLKVLCGGEALPPDLAQSLAQRSAELWNLYGPTETTIWSAQKRLLPGDPVTIGRPIDNTQLYILDRAFQPVPIGVSGELCIGGDGLARGYLNRPDLTAEKFIPNPFSAEPGARMYRTGDLARRLPASRGDIEFLGRIDQQVKIRGFRIELGEIEAVLSQHPDVRASVVLSREDTPGDKRLVAYLVTHQEKSIQTGELRAHLKEKLPDYMLPSAFVFLVALPLTPNGKLDRKALPAPDASQTTRGYVAPSTPTEELLANIWAEVLKLDKVGIHDNFFDLGGHSLLATQVISRLRKTYQIEINLRSLFESPTILYLALQVDEFAKEAAKQKLKTLTIQDTDFFEGEL